MAKKSPLLDRMEANPKADWRIEDVEKLCREVGLNFRGGRGSHRNVSSDYIERIETVPARCPIKPRYIKDLVIFAREHLRCANQEEREP